MAKFDSGRLPIPASRNRSWLWSTGGHQIFAIESVFDDTGDRIVLNFHSSISLNAQKSGRPSPYRGGVATKINLNRTEAPIVLAALLAAMEEAGW